MTPATRTAAITGPEAGASGMAMAKTVRILGTHGVPARYGGFETAAENVGLYLASRGWRVIIYCQVEGSGAIRRDRWGTLSRVLIPVSGTGWTATVRFDLLSIADAVPRRDLCLTFGYNTAVFNIAHRLMRAPNVINMDGVEWSRARWGLLRQAILYCNERAAAVVGNHLIADHPEIHRYLLSRAPEHKITTITYGAHKLTSAHPDVPASHNLEPGRYALIVCRLLPENSVLELVQAFARADCGYDLAIVGRYEPKHDAYHRSLAAAATPNTHFLGTIYDRSSLEALRFHAAVYLHGHTVGGTNPSLVEAMAAGNAVIAHQNPYNRWVAQDAALYFSTPDDAALALRRIADTPELRASLGAAASRRHRAEFTWERIGHQYESLLVNYLPRTRARNAS